LPLKNIRLEIKRSEYGEQGFNRKILNDKNNKADIIRKHETTLETIEP